MLGKAAFALAGSLSLASAQAAKGFNWASNGNAQSNFESDFTAQDSLPNASGFNSARLYTMIQDGTTDTPISAIPAAIATKTTLLLGLWASAGQAAFDNELTALKSAITQYGSDFADAVVGISVGSEDLYRDTYTSQVTNADPNPGASPQTLADYIGQVRDAIKGTALAQAPVGHVDTYTAYINGSNQALIDAVDFCGMDAYPYYQTTEANSIDNAYDLFYSAYDQTSSACGKPVWVTETGWPYSGKQSNDAVASVDNAKRYWDEVGCSLFGKTNVWWFTLADAGSNPAFGILGDSIDGQPLFDLSCSNSTSSSSAPSSSKTSSASASKSASSVASATAPASGNSGLKTSIPTPIPSGGEGSGSSATGSAASASATATGSSGSSSGSGSGSGSVGSGVSGGSGSSGSTGAVGGGSGVNGTGPSSTVSATSSIFTGAAVRAEVGTFGAALLGLAAYLL